MGTEALQAFRRSAVAAGTNYPVARSTGVRSRRREASGASLYRAVRTLRAASGSRVPLGAPRWTPAHLRIDGHSSERFGSHLQNDRRGLCRTRLTIIDFAGWRTRSGKVGEAGRQSAGGELCSPTGNSEAGRAGDHACAASTQSLSRFARGCRWWPCPSPTTNPEWRRGSRARGACVVVPRRRLNAARLRKAVMLVLQDARYREAAQALQRTIQRDGRTWPRGRSHRTSAETSFDLAPGPIRRIGPHHAVPQFSHRRRFMHTLRTSSVELVVPQRLHRRELRSAPRGQGPRYQPRQNGDAKRLGQKEHREGRRDDACGLRQGRQQVQGAPSEGDPQETAAQSKNRRFKLDENQYLPPLPTERPQNADFPCAFVDRHGHGVGDPKDADQQCDRRSAPCRSMRQLDKLIVMRALGCGNGAQSRQSSFDLRLRAL